VGDGVGIVPAVAAPLLRSVLAEERPFARLGVTQWLWERKPTRQKNY